MRTSGELRLVGYLRISSRTQIDGFGLDSQRASIETWAQASGHRIVEWHTDVVSGTTALGDREGLTDALGRIEDGQADGLVVARLDRLARSLVVQEGALASLWALDAQVFAADSGEILADDPDDPLRTMIRQVLGAVAALDRAMIAKRLRDGRRAAAREGAFAGGLPGWEQTIVAREIKGRSRSVLVSDPSKSGAVDLVLAGHMAGRSLRAIGADLLDAGHRPARASAWSAEAVRSILARVHPADCARCAARPA